MAVEADCRTLELMMGKTRSEINEYRIDPQSSNEYSELCLGIMAWEDGLHYGNILNSGLQPSMAFAISAENNSEEIILLSKSYRASEIAYARKDAFLNRYILDNQGCWHIPGNIQEYARARVDSDECEPSSKMEVWIHSTEKLIQALLKSSDMNTEQARAKLIQLFNSGQTLQLQD